jgi:hypothetical protein
MPVGSLLYPAVSNTFTEHVETIALYTEYHITAEWLKYIDNSLRFGQMDQQDLNNFFTISTASDLP